MVLAKQRRKACHITDTHNGIVKALPDVISLVFQPKNEGILAGLAGSLCKEERQFSAAGDDRKATVSRQAVDMSGRRHGSVPTRDTTRCGAPALHVGVK